MTQIKDKLKSILKYKYEKDVVLHNGTGYMQGNGVIIMISRITILGFTFITDIKYDVEGEWTKKFAQKLKDEWVQEKGFIEYILDEHAGHERLSISEKRRANSYRKLLNKLVK